MKPVLWINSRDGSQGWNYIGDESRREDVANLTGDKEEFYDSLSYTFVPESYRAGYQMYRKMAPGLGDKVKAMQSFILKLTAAKETVEDIVRRMDKWNR